MNIIDSSKEFDFSTITLATPKTLQGGSLFTQLSTKEGKPVYVQMEECTTKDGIATPKGKHYCDLMYEEPFPSYTIQWMKQLEQFAFDELVAKRVSWFDDSIREEHIKQLAPKIMNIRQGGKRILMHTYIDMNRNSNSYSCAAFDENDVSIDLKIASLQGCRIIPVILVEGIRMTTKEFELSVKLKQIMILKDLPDLMSECVIKRRQVAIADPTVDTLAKQAEDTFDVVQTDEVPLLLNEQVQAQAEQEQEQAEQDQPQQSEQIQAEQPQEQGQSELEQPQQAEQPQEQAEQMQSELPQEQAEQMQSELPQEQSELPQEQSELPQEQSELPQEQAEQPQQAKQPLPVITAPVIEEVSLSAPDDEFVSIKNQNEIYQEIYEQARQKAKKLRQESIAAYLAVNKIKMKYNIEDSDDEEEDF